MTIPESPAVSALRRAGYAMDQLAGAAGTTERESIAEVAGRRALSDGTLEAMRVALATPGRSNRGPGRCIPGGVLAGGTGRAHVMAGVLCLDGDRVEQQKIASLEAEQRDADGNRHVLAPQGPTDDSRIGEFGLPSFVDECAAPGNLNVLEPVDIASIRQGDREPFLGRKSKDGRAVHLA